MAENRMGALASEFPKPLDLGPPENRAQVLPSPCRSPLDSWNPVESRELLCHLFPASSVGKESAHSAGDLGLIPGLGRSPGEGKCYPLQYSGLENSMD